MAVGIVDRQKLVNIADAVRAKKGITGNMTLDAIASNITSIPTADNNAKFDFAGSGSKSEGNLMSYLTTVDLSNLDTSNYTNMSNMFSGYRNLKSIDVSGLDTSKVIDMSSMFYSCSSLTSLDLSSFNTSKVTYMSSMFSSCKSLTSLDLSNFNTSKVTNVYMMFNGCESLTSLNLSSFDTSKFTGMTDMFSSCKSLTSLDLSSFDTSNVTTMEEMFYTCSSLTSLNLSSFNTSNVTYMSRMFSSCKSLTSLDLSNFNTSKVTGMTNMFYNCSSLKNLTLGENWASNSEITSFDLSYSPLTHESAVDVINKLATRSNSPVIKFSKAVGLYQSEIDVATNKGWSVSGCSVLVEDPSTATVGQYALIDGVVSKCVYVADTPQDWGQRIFVALSDIGKYEWGGYGTSTNVKDTSIGTGLSNTNALIAMGLTSTDGTPTIWDKIVEFRSTHSDGWFVPSRDEVALNKSYYLSSSEMEYPNSSNYAYMGSQFGKFYDSVEKSSKNYSTLPCIYV